MRRRLTELLTGGAPLFPLVVLFGLNAVDELDRTAFGVLIPEIRRDFGLDRAAAFSLVSAVEAGGILLGLLLAYHAERRSRVRMAATGAGLWGVFSFLTGAAPTLVLLAAARVGSGLGRAVTTPTHFSLLADFYATDIRAKVYGVHRAANSVGQFLGPLVAGTLALWLGWRAPFLLFALPTAVFVALALRLREPPRGAHERRAVGADEQAALAEEPPPRFGEALRLLGRSPTLRRIWCSIPFVAALIVGFGTLFATFYEDEFGLNSAQRGVAAAVTEPAQILGLLAGIPLANRLLARDAALVLRFLAVAGVVVAAAFAVLAATPFLVVAVVLHALISATAAVLQPGVYAILSLVMPPRARSIGFAFSALWILPGLVLFPVVGHVADSHGIRPALFLLCPLLLTAGFMLASAGRFVNADIRRVREGALAGARDILERHGEAPA